MRRVLYTAAEAAEAVGVERDTIYNWVRRGYLSPVPGARRGRETLFDLSEVYQCEAARKRQHRRRGQQS